MAIENIPEYVEVVAGDLICAEQWNEIQRSQQHPHPPAYRRVQRYGRR